MRIAMVVRRFFAGFVVIAVCLTMTSSVRAAGADLNAALRNDLETDIWPAAAKRGVPRTVFDRALGKVTPLLALSDLDLPGRGKGVDEVQSQAEFQSPGSYFDEKKLTQLIARGRQLLVANRALLARIEAKTGVPGPIVVAIWGRETGFGAAHMPYDAFQVLATRAFLSRPSKKEMYRSELLAALDIVAAGHLSVADMRSSSAGALGQPQFMPSKFAELAVDADGDGRPDIWRSIPDTLSSIAHFLQVSGWVRGRGWFYEARVPPDVSCRSEGPDQGRPLAAFLDRGVARVVGRPFPEVEAKGSSFLLMPAGRSGPAFVATPNFYVLKTYNNSDLYALFIGHLADRMTGALPLATPFGPPTGLTRGDVARLQARLVERGLDVGGADGLPGFKTRRSIGAVEEQAGSAATCWPSRSLVRRLDQG